MQVERVSVLVLVALLAVPAHASRATPTPSPSNRLLTYLWNYHDWLLRPFVAEVTLTGGHTITVNGRRRRVAATANIHESLRDQPALTPAARHICLIAAAAVETLHLRSTITVVQVWSVEGHAVARC